MSKNEEEARPLPIRAAPRGVRKGGLAVPCHFGTAATALSTQIQVRPVAVDAQETFGPFLYVVC